MAEKTILLQAHQIRYTQDSIKGTFNNGGSLQATRDKVLQGNQIGRSV